MLIRSLILTALIASPAAAFDVTLMFDWDNQKPKNLSLSSPGCRSVPYRGDVGSSKGGVRIQKYDENLAKLWFLDSDGNWNGPGAAFYDRRGEVIWFHTIDDPSWGMYSLSGKIKPRSKGVIGGGWKGKVNYTAGFITDKGGVCIESLHDLRAK